MSAPEITLYPDDRFYAWAEKLVYENEEVCIPIVKGATAEDMTSLFGALTDDLWPAHRRAFASKLFQLAMEVDSAGGDASKGFAEFYRARYDPPYIFHVEKPVIKAGSPVHHTPTTADDDE